MVVAVVVTAVIAAVVAIDLMVIGALGINSCCGVLLVMVFEVDGKVDGKVDRKRQVRQSYNNIRNYMGT